MYVKCLNIEKAHYGENNFNLASTYNNIGFVYKGQGKLDQALEIYLKSLKIKKAHYGENNFNLASTYNNTGIIYKE
jgi:tetratricopeptide (TPR) repeat protein